ncbi:MAG TPA: RDD family protein [Burkholderiales bacterium]|jgi:uncharacterized RDD family membrane protein YckC
MLDTTRRVATPEGIELTLRLAGPVPRALAWAIDLAIRLTLMFAVAMLASLLGRAGMGVILLTAFFVEWLLPAWFEARWNGQTPGKRAMGIAVLNDDGTPLRWPAALTRNLLRAVDFLPVLYGVGLVAMLSNRDFKRLGDLAAGTVVVYLDTNKQTIDRKIPEAAPIFPPVPLTLEEQRALLELAERSASLTQERFEELAELPRPLVGNLDGPRAAARLIGMANHIAGRQ